MKMIENTYDIQILLLYSIFMKQYIASLHLNIISRKRSMLNFKTKFTLNILKTIQLPISNKSYTITTCVQLIHKSTQKKKEIPKIKDPSFFYSKKQTIIDLQQQFISINIQILFNQNDRRQLHMPILLQIISMITSLAVVHKYIYIYLYNNIITYQSYRTLFPSNMFQSQAYFLLQSKHRNKSILVNYFKQHHKNFKSLC
eukprot:TRINITY_DN204_c1_g1_i10.p1 TRINITY_DN204_c1_g1~~TRINITY_DN204_c1_g1_i10.p1  ORF type:complete len:200 (-),score=-21.60 TRINITY_DN204_c1_g1_i10:524-1123(-)